MAHIDKVTTMRRLALVWSGYPNESNGAIAYEGVNIEGFILLHCHEGLGEFVIIDEAEIDEFCKKNEVELVYQDKEETIWEPRLERIIPLIESGK